VYQSFGRQALEARFEILPVSSPCAPRSPTDLTTEGARADSSSAVLLHALLQRNNRKMEFMCS